MKSLIESWIDHEIQIVLFWANPTEKGRVTTQFRHSPKKFYFNSLYIREIEENPRFVPRQQEHPQKCIDDYSCYPIRLLIGEFTQDPCLACKLQLIGSWKIVDGGAP